MPKVCSEWCGYCYSNLRGRTNKAGHAGFRKPKEEGKRMAMKPPSKPKTTPDTVHEIPKLAKTDLASKYPLVAAMLCHTAYEDGSQRQTSTLLFFVEGERLRVCMNDRDAGRSCFLTVASIEDALDTLEAGLSEESLPWRGKARG